MGALVLISLLSAIPACAFAAFYWARVATQKKSENVARLTSRAAGWTALALLLQALSLFATAYVAFVG